MSQPTFADRPSPAPGARTYEVRTYGCQMNVHDSERLAGLLEGAGYVRADRVPTTAADVVVFNTCAVRENADNRLYGNLGHLAPVKAARPGMQIAVGGCLAQKDRGEIVRRAPWVDVVFGTHNIGSLPALLERARHNEEAQVEILEALETFPSTLPTRRESAYSGWVSISVGCNNTCTFCIVPSLRGVEKDRRPGDVLAEVEALVAEGVLEVTLLGQNVNSYGVEFGDRGAFAKLLRACGDVDGLERVRFTSPHPRDFTDRRHRRHGRDAERHAQPAHAAAVRVGLRAQGACGAATARTATWGSSTTSAPRIPDAAITTDIIVGFPGETEADFQATLDVVRAARFAGAFTFQYSPRPGTPAAGHGRPGAEVGRAGTLRAPRRPAGRHGVGREPGPRGPYGRGARGRGRGTQGRGHRPAVRPRAGQPPRPLRPRGRGARVPVTWSRSRSPTPPRTTWCPTVPRRAVRRTRAGDAWSARTSSPPRAVPPPAPGVLLGMPQVGAPRS